MTPQTTVRGQRASSTTKRPTIIATAAALVLAACGGGDGVKANNGGPGHVTGLVIVSGTVATGTITAYRLDATTMVRGATLVSGTTKADGTFDLTIPPYNGHIEVVVTNGSYLEQAAGLTVQVTRDLTAYVPSFSAGTTRTITVSPISSFVHELTKAEVGRGTAFATAEQNAWTHVNAHFGGVDWRSIIPTDLTPANTVNVTMSDNTKAGLILASLSQEARTISETSGLSPGTSVTASALGGAAEDDVADGTVDGLASTTAITLGTVNFTGQTFRGDLSEAVLAFVSSSANKTNLRGTDIWTLATAMATNNDPFLFCPGQTACVTMLPPAPELRSGLATYYDERTMTLAAPSVPPQYQFPPGAPKLDPTTNGIYKAASRLMWTAQPTPSDLEGANSDNVPFVQVRIPVGASQLPLATINYAIDDGTSRYTGSLDPWKSPLSTITNLYYDIPITADIVSSLGGAGPSPRNLDIYVTAADVNGVIASNIHVGTIAFHIVGPPVHVAEDTAYPTYNSNHSTFLYTLANQTYEQLWNPSVTYFTNGMVRLVRYVISNPAPYAIALQPTFTTTGPQGWRVSETWQRFNGGAPTGAELTLDGYTFGGSYCQCISGSCSSNAPANCRWGNPWGGQSTAAFGHEKGVTTAAWTSPASVLPSYGSSEIPSTFDTSFTSTVTPQVFVTPSATGDETTFATVTDGYPVVPAAYGSTPGKLVLYLTRPVTTPRVYSSLAWNQFTTTNNRYEALENLGFSFAGSFPCGWQLSCNLFGPFRGAVNLKSTVESLTGTVSIITRGLSGTFAVGEPATAFSTAVNATSLSTH